jgi:hypothetical protein
MSLHLLDTDTVSLFQHGDPIVWLHLMIRQPGDL